MDNPNFVKQDNFSRQFESLIEEENKKRSSLITKTIFTPSILTECPRRIIYQVMENKPEKETNYSELSSNEFSKKKWMDYFKKFKGIKLVEENLMAADCNYNISGTLDAVIQMTNDEFIATQIFFVNNKIFEEIQNGGALKKNVIELLVYMWLTELSNGLLIYENKDTNKYLTFHIEPYQPIITSVQKKCMLLMESKLKGIIPEKPYKNQESSECSQCQFLKKCWK